MQLNSINISSNPLCVCISLIRSHFNTNINTVLELDMELDQLDVLIKFPDIWFLFAQSFDCGVNVNAYKKN